MELTVSYKKEVSLCPPRVCISHHFHASEALEDGATQWQDLLFAVRSELAPGKQKQQHCHSSGAEPCEACL